MAPISPQDPEKSGSKTLTEAKKSPMNAIGRTVLAASLALVASLSASAQQTSTTTMMMMEKKATMSLADAKAVIAAAAAEAKRNNARGAIAVVDDGGNLLAVERLDGTFAAGSMVSIGKARTAALFRKPTSFFANLINKGRTAMTTLPDFTPLQGGVPIEVDGQIVGAVGVSGANSAQQDEDIAVVAAKALASGMKTGMAMPREMPVAYFESGAVGAAFAKGAPLLEVGDYKIHASRREKPGQAEIHLRDTDIIYFLDGKATLVTGGEVKDPQTVAPDEVRGAEIKGGESRCLAKGDVLVVPSGTPHWFREVEGPVLYYVVKVSGSGMMAQ